MKQAEQNIRNEYELLTLKDQQRIRNLTLMDDDFMTKCFDGDNKSIELILQIILNRQDLKVMEVKVQNVIKNLKGKSATLDVFAQDISGKVYNIEIQNKKKGANPKRARYHSSLMDVNLLKAGEEEEQLPETYMIFHVQNRMRCIMSCWRNKQESSKIMVRGVSIWDIFKRLEKRQELRLLRKKERYLL